MTQRVLVTAGASGIGREIALAFAQAGAKVFVGDIDQTALTKIASENPAIITGLADVSDPRSVEAMVAAATSALGGLDVLVNNAGIAGPTAAVQDFDPEAWQKVLDVNLTGTFNVTRLAIPHLKKSPAGVIINMSSVAGKYGYPNRVAYSTTKWGIIGFTKTLSIELGPDNIRVNAILPGAVAGPRFQKVVEGRAQASGRSVEEEMADAMAAQSLKRLVDPGDIAAYAVFLASDSAKSISGQALSIDNDMLKAQ
jgi:NAD(P)-dependent dehydrogenase (short-subunit alcohol dehydrogenase family)